MGSALDIAEDRIDYLPGLFRGRRVCAAACTVCGNPLRNGFRSALSSLPFLFPFITKSSYAVLYRIRDFCRCLFLPERFRPTIHHPQYCDR